MEQMSIVSLVVIWLFTIHLKLTCLVLCISQLASTLFSKYIN